MLKPVLFYALQLGWPVLPLHHITDAGGCSCGHVQQPDGLCECGNPKCSKKHKPGSSGKHPRESGWEESASVDEETIHRWFKAYPGCNFGIATGEAAGIFVLDIDPRHDGDRSLEKLQREHGPLPDTAIQETPSGGQHYLFRVPPGVQVSNAPLGRREYPGIDIRGNAGLIAAFPSVTMPTEGERVRYRWRSAKMLDKVASAPAWLVEMLAKRSNSTSASAPTARPSFPAATLEVLARARQALQLHGPAVDGNAGGLHTVHAGSILTHDFALELETEAFPLLLEWNATCVPPWTPDDLRERLRRGERYGKLPYGCRRDADGWQVALKMIEDWRRDPGADPEASAGELVERCREVPYSDPTRRAQVVRALRSATGLSPADLAIPPAVDLKARADRDERRKAFMAGAADLLDVDHPLDAARRFLAERKDAEGLPDLARWQGEYWQAVGSHYEARTEEEINGQLYGFLDGKREVGNGAPVKPDRHLVADISHALNSAASVTAREAPAWLSSTGADPSPGEMIAFRNGLLHVPPRAFQAPTRRFFTQNALGFDYAPEAPEPHAWLAFLRNVWPDDSETIETLQEFFGLALTGDTSHQKIFMVIGPPRSGKGTIARVLQALVGDGNHCAPTLAGLETHFGLEGLIGKTLAIISDARLSARTDQSKVAENLLRISGEDMISVPRKMRTDFNAKLRTRFLMLANEVPALLDQSGALASRFIMLRMTKSFLGEEDRGLSARLLAELPGIMHWSLEGLDRLRGRGYFCQPKSAQEAVRQLQVLGSPVRAFVEERCEVTPGVQVECAALYAAWASWCAEQGRDHPGTVQVFGRNLSSAIPAVTLARPRVEGDRVRVYQGVRLRAA